MHNDRHDVIVIGGSFAGLAAAIQMGRARRDVLVVDAGQPRNRFSRASHGFPGQDGRKPADIIADFRAEVLAYPSVRFREGFVTDARAVDDGFELTLDGGDVLRSLRLVLATGVADDLPPVPGLIERWGVSVLHCPYCDGWEVADRRLGVIATNPMAVHKALLLTDWSADVTLFTGGEHEPGDEEMPKLTQRGVRIESRPIVELVGATPALEGLRLADGSVQPLDALFVATGALQASPLAERLGCAIDDGPQGPVVRTDARKLTTVPGVFSAGDSSRAPHNALWAAADGAMAGVAAHQSLVFG